MRLIDDVPEFFVLFFLKKFLWRRIDDYLCLSFSLLFSIVSFHYCSAIVTWSPLYIVEFSSPTRLGTFLSLRIFDDLFCFLCVHVLTPPVENPLFPSISFIWREYLKPDKRILQIASNAGLKCFVFVFPSKISLFSIPKTKTKHFIRKHTHLLGGGRKAQTFKFSLV